MGHAGRTHGDHVFPLWLESENQQRPLQPCSPRRETAQSAGTVPPKPPGARQVEALTLRPADAPGKKRQDPNPRLRKGNSGRQRQVPAAGGHAHAHAHARRRTDCPALAGTQGWEGLGLPTRLVPAAPPPAPPWAPFSLSAPPTTPAPRRRPAPLRQRPLVRPWPRPLASPSAPLHSSPWA